MNFLFCLLLCSQWNRTSADSGNGGRDAESLRREKKCFSYLRCKGQLVTSHPHSYM